MLTAPIIVSDLQHFYPAKCFKVETFLPNIVFQDCNIWSQMNLREYLKMSNLTQEEFCEHLNISRTTLYRLLNGEKEPSLSLAMKIVKATKNKVTFEDLLPNDSNKQ